MRAVLLAAMCVVGVTGGAALAQSDPTITAKRASQMLLKASEALSDAERASDRVAALTKTIQAYEEGLSALREGLRRVSIRQSSIAAGFEAQRGRLSRLLGVLQTMNRSPAPLLLLHPSGALGTARSGMIMSDVAPALQAQALALKAQLEEVAALQSIQEQAEATLRKSLEDLQKARVALAKAVADRKELPAPIANDPQRMADLLSASDTLQAFADGLLRLSDAEDNSGSRPSFAGARGALDLPVSGVVIRGFEAGGAGSGRHTGLTIATPSLSVVTAPWDTSVRFSGPLLEYGNVVILEPEPGFMIVLAGVSEPYVSEGEILRRGAPVGLMGGAVLTADSFLMDVAQGSGGILQESLYIELRQGNRPLDPAEWFAMNRE